MKEDTLSYIRNNKEITFEQKIRLVIMLSLPTILAQVSSIIMQYIDASMVGRLGAGCSASIGLVSVYSTGPFPSILYRQRHGCLEALLLHRHLDFQYRWHSLSGQRSLTGQEECSYSHLELFFLYQLLLVLPEP